MSGEDQLALEFGHCPALGRDDFLVAPCNAEAVAWLERWPRWRLHALAIHGPAGCGKSHLLAAFAQSNPELLVLDAGHLDAESLAQRELPPVVAVEDMDRLTDEEAFHHLWNRVMNEGRHLILTSRTVPSRLAVKEPRVHSRLVATQAVGIGAPDDSLLAALLVKQFADRQLRVAEDVVTYILGRMERSFAAARAVVEALDQASLAKRRPITVPLARAVLEGMDHDDRQGELEWS